MERDVTPLGLPLAVFRRAAAFFLFLAVAAPSTFPHPHEDKRHQWERRGEREREGERHGRNAYSFVTYFYIDKIEREDGKIEIEFNAPVDPRAVSAESFIINGEPLLANARYKLSRKGNKVEIIEPAEWRGKEVSIEVAGLRSVNGAAIETIPPIFLGEDDEYERDDDLEYVYWQWYDANGGRAFRRE